MRRALALPIETGRLRLRRLAATDLERFVAYRSDAVVGRYQGWSPMSRDAARGFLQQMADAEGLVGGQWLQLAIADANTDALLGDLGLHPDERFESLEIGFTLAADQQGRGYATEAVGAVARALFCETPIRSIRAVTDARNLPSVALLERLGFERAATHDAVFRGEPCVEYVYVLERSGESTG